MMNTPASSQPVPEPRSADLLHDPVAEVIQHDAPGSAVHGSRHHLIDVGDLRDAEIERVWQRARDLQTRDRRGISTSIFGTLRGHVVATLFFEASTRTRLSFELAAQRLGGLTLPLDVSRSSLEKSESLSDTLQTLAAMGATMAVVRHRDNSVFGHLGSELGLSLLNAGNGTEAHPTQALLDAFTIYEALGSLHQRTVVIAGDILHSRVARSNARLLGRLGAQVLLCGPSELLPQSRDLQSFAGAQIAEFEEAIPYADAIMCLRVQRERHAGAEPGDGSATHGTQASSFLVSHGLTVERFALAKPGCLILHPGPVNRDVEIAAALVDHPRSRILQQVRNGLYIRMATLEWIAGVLP